jgi:hypothetical protein
MTAECRRGGINLVCSNLPAERGTLFDSFMTLRFQDYTLDYMGESKVFPKSAANWQILHHRDYKEHGARKKNLGALCGEIDDAPTGLAALH